MRSLAAFVMRGRMPALLIATIGLMTGLFYWVGAAVLGLVTLRKGIAEGLYLLLWCSLPTGFLFWYNGDVVPLTAIFSIVLAAWLLRSTRSWQLSLLVISLSGLFTATFLLVGAHDFLQGIADNVAGLQEQIATQAESQPNQQQATILGLNFSTTVIAGLFGAFAAYATTVSLVLARWWQASLFNPGGFQQEFHNLRLSAPVASGLFVGVLLIAGRQDEYSLWSAMLIMPLLVSGIALAHAWVKRRAMNSHWLGFFYVLLIFVDLFKLIVVMAALVDSWFDFRKRLPTPDKPDDDQP